MIRDFSNQEEHNPPARNLEDAPVGIRLELIDLIFGIVEHQPQPQLITTDHIYRVISQSLGIRAAGNPYAGFRHAAGRDIAGAPWQRVYDLICRLWPEFARVGLQAQFLDGVNRILAGYGSAWELRADGSLQRVLPVAAHEQVQAAFVELQAARYAPALALLTAAADAYNDRPRRNREACANAFDAMESVVKERYAMPNDTFGAVVNHLRRVAAFNPQTLGLLDSINTLRNRTFGHGMAAAFNLTDAEVDFTYLTCVAAILLFTRTP